MHNISIASIRNLSAGLKGRFSDASSTVRMTHVGRDEPDCVLRTRPSLRLLANRLRASVERSEPTPRRRWPTTVLATPESTKSRHNPACLLELLDRGCEV